jgi:hypothetical protein
VVGGDAVATRRFLGNNPSLANLAHASAAPFSSLRDLLVLPELSYLAGSAVADIPCLGADPWRVGDAVLESYS